MVLGRRPQKLLLMAYVYKKNPDLDKQWYGLLDVKVKNQTTGESYTNCVKLLQEHGVDVNRATNAWTTCASASSASRVPRSRRS